MVIGQGPNHFSNMSDPILVIIWKDTTGDGKADTVEKDIDGDGIVENPLFSTSPRSSQVLCGAGARLAGFRCQSLPLLRKP